MAFAWAECCEGGALNKASVSLESNQHSIDL